MRTARPVLLAVLLAPSVVGASCVERRVWIETDPPGALVWINDAQAGRTPVDVEFTHHGTYDLRIEKEGFEPLLTAATTEGPLWDTAPIDFVVEVLPVRARSETRWKFALVPRDDSEEALLGRAAALRDRLASDAARAARAMGAGEAVLEREIEAVQDKPQDPALEPKQVPSLPPAP